MNIERQLPQDILPCSTLYQSDSQPYYIVAPAYRHQSAGVRLLHEMCSLLNQMGYEAYVDAPQTSGHLWTPRLTDVTKIAHYKAGKTPIVVYPEVVKGTPLELGLPVRYVLNFPGYLGGDKGYSKDELIYTFLDSFYPGAKRLYLPLLDLKAMDFEGTQTVERDIEVAYYHNRYTKGGGKLRDFGPNAFEISSTQPDTNAKTLAVLRRAKRLYCYEFSGIMVEAALCGCPVVLLPNPITLKELPPTLPEIGMEGIAWGEDPEEIARAERTVGDRKVRYLRDLSVWQSQLQDFIAQTQERARQFPAHKAWPTQTVDKLPFADLSAAQIADRADRRKYTKINEQYKRWMEFCTLREVDADIYAEYLTSGVLPPVSVLIDHRQSKLDGLADTLDSLSASLGQPARLAIVSESAVPEALSGDPNIDWHVLPAGQSLEPAAVAGLGTHWILLLKSGTRLAPQALLEWALATREYSTADLIYADEDSWIGEEGRSYPYFKPSANIELLRCTNYLGTALLVQAPSWQQAGCPLLGAGIYGFALQCVQARGRVALGHIDTILSHGDGQIGAELENQEYLAARHSLVGSGLAASVKPQPRLGTWLVDYPVAPTDRVSLVIPTGLQTGYLRSLIQSLYRYPQAQLAEVVLVCATEQLEEVEFALADVARAIPVRTLTLERSEYNHAQALNAGIAAATSPFVLVCDDDTEILHADWLTPLLGIAAQADVGCVGPRLMTNRGGEHARVSGGPMVLGILGTVATYIGEEGRLEEAGVFSRLQLSQDVGTVNGHFFLMRRSHWSAVGGFDEKDFNLCFPVLDFCLRLAEQGLRHVWTPLCNVMHQAGRSVAATLRDNRTQLRWADRELTEKDLLLTRWSRQLANDRCYNRHLSLHTLFDVESDIVVDWNPRRRERTRLLAAPLTSGAGQYRVIEPLDALQNASLAQTCTVLPKHRNSHRFLQPLELVRAAPDKLILQHSVDDVQLSLTSKYRMVMPDIPIVQMVDDLLGEVPEKHPNRVFQSREGHQRMTQALKQSDRLIVTTEPLADFYKKYVPDVWRIPNALGAQWLGLNKVPAARERLRVGWIGAGQHKGDLDLVAEVVRQLAPEVDWVFMGMATDEIRPHLKEFHGYVSMGGYPKYVSELNLDIAIAPLEDNMFNACKSNLRLLEYGAMGWPVVCSDVFPYRFDNPPVLRCANTVDAWLAALRRLIDDRELRLSMGAELNRWLHANYLLEGMVTKWKQCLID